MLYLWAGKIHNRLRFVRVLAARKRNPQCHKLYILPVLLEETVPSALQHRRQVRQRLPGKTKEALDTELNLNPQIIEIEGEGERE